MDQLTLSQVASWVGETNNLDAIIKDVVIDSRQATEGSLFVALTGELTDGHNYVEQVLDNGGFALVRKGFTDDSRCVTVTDPLTALQIIAQRYLARLAIPVVAVTGSNGKTTTKDLIAGVLSRGYKVHKTQGNFNNEIGLPLTLLDLDTSDDLVVVEMGMRGKGQITELTRIAPPDIGVITNIGPVHLELLGSQENIANAKGELLAGLKRTGTAILNGDDPLVRSQAPKAPGKVVYVGTKDNAQLRALDVMVTDQGHTRFKVTYQGKEYPVRLNVPGLHNVTNALLAIAVGLEMKLDIEQCIAGLLSVEMSSMRMEVISGNPEITIVNDAYNASPASVTAALHTLASMAPKERRVAILGDMLELGALSQSAHREIGNVAAHICDRLIYVGQFAADFSQGANQAGFPQDSLVLCKKNTDAAQILFDVVRPEDTVLVKASRGVALEVVVEGLQRGRGFK